MSKKIREGLVVFMNANTTTKRGFTEFDGMLAEQAMGGYTHVLPGQFQSMIDDGYVVLSEDNTSVMLGAKRAYPTQKLKDTWIAVRDYTQL